MTHMVTFIELMRDEKTATLIQGLVRFAGQFVMQNIQGDDDLSRERKALDTYYIKATALAEKISENKNGGTESIDIPSPDDEIDIPEIELDDEIEKVSIRDTKTQACVACSRNHIAAAAGLLSEGKRFLKNGLTSDEVLNRIDLASQEITTMERGDLHPDKISRLPEDEKRVAEWLASEAQRIRHVMDHISTEKEYMNAINELTKFSKEITKRYYTMMENMSPEKIQKSIDHLCDGLPDDKRAKCAEMMTSITKE